MGEVMTATQAGYLDPAYWRRRRVFLTGHTGFIGGWLTAVLHGLGAEVFGYALAAPTNRYRNTARTLGG